MMSYCFGASSVVISFGRCRRVTIAVIFCVLPFCVQGEVTRVAVAGNFGATMREIVDEYRKLGGASVNLSSGSTGKLYSQILRSAPFDMFFAADVLRPRSLEEGGIGVPFSRYTYAVGKLALWSLTMQPRDSSALSRGDFRFLAIANPLHAPYGKATVELLRRLGLLDGLRSRFVLGENISQVFGFVVSANAELGFIAFSQLRSSRYQSAGHYWLPDTDLYPPIEQQALLLNDTGVALDFWRFVKSDVARAIIAGHGYDLP